MSQIVIGVDCDGTVIAMHDIWINLYNTDYRQNLKNEDITHWGIEQFVVPECGNKIFDYLSYPELYEKSLPVEGAIRGVCELRQLGIKKKIKIKIKYLTSTVPQAMGRKKVWLEKWGFLKPEDEYYETDKKYLYPHDYLIDDNIDNCKSSCGKGVLLTQPHNKSSLYNPRCDSWSEIIKFFQEELR